MEWENRFSDLPEYYPGSSKRIQRDAEEPQSEPAAWDATPRTYEFGGVHYEFYSIGDLAAALQKRPVTIRLWESRGYIPKPLRAPAKIQDMRQRIYSRAQIDGIVRIAAEEGILHVAKPKIEQTRFRERVLDLFLELAQKPANGADKVR